jgi:uncharacterized membrane protein HdeD (DUF308 family)
VGQDVNTPLSIFTTSLLELRRNWEWLLGLGMALIVLGVIALADSVFVTVVSILVLGSVLLVAGLVEAVQALRHRRSAHLFLHALNAALSMVIGLMLVRHPLVGAAVVTMLLAAYFTVAGIFRIVAALALRTPSRGWALANGIVTLLLGIMVWAQWPVSGLWILGLFIGLDLIVVGCSQVMLAAAVRKLHLESV